MRTAFTQAFAMMIGCISGWGALPTIPMPTEVVRYERLEPVFKSNQLSKERGDELLLALEGGRQIQKRPPLPPGVVCALPIPASHWLTITRTNGAKYRIGLSFNGALVYLPEGDYLYEVTDAARGRVEKFVRKLDDDLRREILDTPKPLVYTVSLVEDGGTLSGLAKFFYGDAGRWKQIYEANRRTIKNPNKIESGMKLTIPKLK